MVIYHGVVKDNVVVLNENAQLPDGVAVEIHVPIAPSLPDDRELLRTRGLLQDTTTASPAPLPAGIDRSPIPVRGQPLSEAIIAERR